jgi:hypothetical protein
VPAEQESPGGHGLQGPAPVPQANGLVPDSHVPELSQQPVGQLVTLQVAPMHAPALQTSPPGHGSQALPPLPHAEVLVPDSQRPMSSQHPVGQVEALQGMASHVWLDGSQTRPVPAQS